MAYREPGHHLRLARGAGGQADVATFALQRHRATRCGDQARDAEPGARAEQADGWLVIEEMYDKHNHQFRLEVVNTIINGNEAAVHHRNCIVGTNQVIESIETYRFGPGSLHVRYFLKPPVDAAVNLEQFRGFAATPSQEAP